MEVVQSIDIERPLSEVFSYMCDMENHSKFSSAFTDCRQLSEGEFGVGALVVKVACFMGKDIESHQKITGFVQDQLIVFESTSGPLDTTETFFFEEQPDKSTKLVIIVEGEPKGMMKLASGAIKNKVSNQIVQDLSNLKNILEQQEV